ncbi:hypothetical protein JX266_006118 [Neoarthrinium moseri]|nr:hypothetical protein JX266_006118 [Neoarthrinium moseri]
MDTGLNTDPAILIDSESDHGLDSDSSTDSEHGQGTIEYWKQQFSRQLDGIKTVGDFAASKQYSTFANPGLEAPFGRGDETLVDENVRKTWELSNDRFKLANPAWPRFFETVCQGASASLGIPGVRFEPYKLLLYEEGSFFKRHKDSEKMPGMIGTLVVCLPSQHEGGDVHLALGDKQRTFSTSSASAFDITSLAWFSDVTHEVTRLTSGYRLVLTYNIVKSRPSVPSPRALIKQQEDVGGFLSSLSKQFKEVDHLVHPLEHKYTESSLSLRNMKGRDHTVCNCLERQSSKHGCYILLANLTKTREPGDMYYDEEDEGETSLTLDCVVSCDGDLVASDVDIEMADTFGHIRYAHRDADSEDEGEFTGNESMPSKYRYHDSVVVIIPKTRFHTLLGTYRSDSETRNMLKVVEDDLLKHPEDQRTRKFALEFMAKQLTIATSLGGATLASTAQWAVKLGHKHLLHSAIRQSVHIRAWDHVVLAIAAIINDGFRQNSELPEWGVWLNEFVKASRNLTELGSILLSLDLQLSEGLRPSFKAWQSLQEERQLEQKPTLVLSDLNLVAKMVETHSGNIEWVQSKLAPSLTGRGEKNLIIAVANQLLKKSQEGINQAERDMAREMAEVILESTVSKLPLKLAEITTCGGWDFAQAPTTPKFLIKQEALRYPTNFLLLVDSCFRHPHQLRNMAKELLESTCAPLVESQRHWPDRIGSVDEFLSTIMLVYNRNTQSLSPAVKTFWAAVFRTYVIGAVPAYPKQLPGLQHRARGCSDASRRDCRDLDEFLLSTTERTFELKANEKRRRHVADRLPGGLYGNIVFKIETNTRSKSPYTLISTNMPSKEFQHDLASYRRQLAVIRDKVEPYRQDYINKLLGDDMYDELIMLNKIRDVPASTTSGVKRKALDELPNLSSSRMRFG